MPSVSSAKHEERAPKALFSVFKMQTSRSLKFLRSLMFLKTQRSFSPSPSRDMKKEKTFFEKEKNFMKKESRRM